MKKILKMRLRNRRPQPEERLMTRDIREWAPLRDVGEQMAQQRYQMTPAGKALLASLAREDHDPRSLHPGDDQGQDVSIHQFCPSFCDHPSHGKDDVECKPWPDSATFPYPSERD